VSSRNLRSNLWVILFSGKRRPDPQRLEGFAEMERPRTKKELRKLLGAFGYYREYIPHFAHIAKSLTDLIGKNSPNVLPWENEQQCFAHTSVG